MSEGREIRGFIEFGDTRLKPPKRVCGSLHRRIWRRFKREFGGQALDRFDAEITRLDRFERIRYPEEMARRDAQISFSFTPPPGLTARVTGGPPRYALQVNELDHLIAEMFRIAGVNPKFFSMRIKADARKYLTEDNPAAHIW